MNNYNWLIYFSLLVLAAGCNVEGEDRKELKSRPVLPVTTLYTTSTTLTREYVGELDAHQNVEIRARVTGFIEKIFVDEGKNVQQGQLLFQISNDEYEAEVSRAKAKLKSALADAKSSEVELNRIRTLVEKKVLADSELEVAKARYDAIYSGIENAQSDLKNAITRLSYTQIRAPFNGVMNRIPFKMGSLVEEGTLLSTVSDLSSIYAYFNVSEREYLEYIKNRKGSAVDKKKKVALVLADGTTYKYDGIIETMEGEFNESTGSIAFRARFENPEKMLKHGSTGTILLTNDLENALIVPQKSAFEIQDKHYVFVVGKDQKVKMKSFVPKTRLDDYYVVESGLTSGEKIVYEGVQKVQDGMSIIPKQVVGLDSLNQAQVLTSNN